MFDPKPNATPTDVLRDEHQLILRVVVILERLIEQARTPEDLDHVSVARCVEFLRLFADACHHAKEEDLLFPVLERCGIPRESGPIGVMLAEHRTARELVRSIGAGLDGMERDAERGFSDVCENGRQYIRLIRQHILKEDHVLYPMGDRAMSQGDQETLCAQFGQTGCQRFGGQSVEALTGMVDALELACPER